MGPNPRSLPTRLTVRRRGAAAAEEDGHGTESEVAAHEAHRAAVLALVAERACDVRDQEGTYHRALAVLLRAHREVQRVHVAHLKSRVGALEDGIPGPLSGPAADAEARRPARLVAEEAVGPARLQILGHRREDLRGRLVGLELHRAAGIAAGAHVVHALGHNIYS